VLRKGLELPTALKADYAVLLKGIEKVSAAVGEFLG